MNANTDYLDLLEATENNANLSPEEKETNIGWCSDEDTARIHTEEKHVARRLLAHPEFTLTRYYTSSNENSWGRAVDAEDYEANGHDQRKPVYGVEGTMPILTIGVKTKSPNRGGHAGVVTAKWLKQTREEEDVDV